MREAPSRSAGVAPGDAGVTAAPDTGADWARVLDDFAAHLAAQRAALTAGQPELVGEFEPPAGLGPLPAHLAERARRLREDNEALVAALEAARARVTRDLEALERSATSEAPAVPSFVDRRA